MENNVLTRCVTYQVHKRDNKEVQELNSDCKVSDTWNESDAIPCWVDSEVESIKEEDAIGSDRVQKPVVTLIWSRTYTPIYLQINTTWWPHIELDLVYTWEGLWFRNCHLVPW